MKNNIIITIIGLISALLIMLICAYLNDKILSREYRIDTFLVGWFSCMGYYITILSLKKVKEKKEFKN